MREVPVEATYELRRRVLRDGDPEADVSFAGDGDPGAFHLAVVDGGGRPLGVASALPTTTDCRPGRRSWRLRAMAVDPAHQGHGLGSALLDALVTRARTLGAEILWAAGRDSALGFYQARGWLVEGPGYLLLGDVPHHTVILDLAH